MIFQLLRLHKKYKGIFSNLYKYTRITLTPSLTESSEEMLNISKKKKKSDKVNRVTKRMSLGSVGKKKGFFSSYAHRTRDEIYRPIII